MVLSFLFFIFYGMEGIKMDMEIYQSNSHKSKELANETTKPEEKKKWFKQNV